METLNNYFFPRHGVCADKEELENRSIAKQAFDTGVNAEDAKVAKACRDCPVQLECFDDAVDSIRKGLRIMGVRAGMSAGDVGKLTSATRSKELYATRERLEVQQQLARQALQPIQ